MTAQLAESNEKLRAAERALVDAESDVRIRRDELETLRETLADEGFVATADGEVERLPEPEPERSPKIDDDEEPPQAYAVATNPGEPPSWLRTDDDDDDGLPPVRGGATVDVDRSARPHRRPARARSARLGPINEEAADEYGESRERFDFLTGQLNDLQRGGGRNCIDGDRRTRDGDPRALPRRPSSS